VHTREDSFFIFKIKQAGKRALLDQIAKEVLGGVIRGNAGWHDDPSVAAPVHQCAEVFGKQGISVYIPQSSQRESLGFPHKFAGTFCSVLGVLKFLCQSWVS